MLKFISKHWKVITTVSVVFNVVLGYLFQHYYFLSNQKNEELSLAFGTSPKLSLTFEANSGQPSYFRLRYYGPSDLENFWVEEKIYLLTDSSVSECRDAPRFQYLHFKGSMRSMGNLPPLGERKIMLPDCWQEFMGILTSKFRGVLVSRFSLRGSSPNSPEFKEDRYFQIDVRNRYYQPLDEVPSGELFRNRIVRYNSEGPKSEIKWIPFLNNYWPNPPRHWYYDQNKVFKPWYGMGLPPGKGRDSAFIFFDKDPFTIQVEADASAKLFWECKDMLSTGVTVFKESEEF